MEIKNNNFATESKNASEKEPVIMLNSKLAAGIPVMMSADEQSVVLLPIIDEERKAFIKIEYGRLAAVMGTEYWNNITKSSGVFHGEINELTDLVSKKIVEPYELSINELALLPTLDKVVERMGTTSYMAFYSMYPEDIERLEFLAEIWNKINDGILCSAEEIKQLFEGHDEYIDKMVDDDVQIIM